VVLSLLLGPDPALRDLAMDVVGVWRARGRVPAAVESLCALEVARRADEERECGGRGGSGLPLGASASASASVSAATTVTALYALPLVRFVNALGDINRKGAHASSMKRVADARGVDPVLVTARHQICHNEVPSLAVLRRAADRALAWLRPNYWEAQVGHLMRSSLLAAQAGQSRVQRQGQGQGRKRGRDDGVELRVDGGEEAAQKCFREAVVVVRALHGCSRDRAEESAGWLAERQETVFELARRRGQMAGGDRDPLVNLLLDVTVDGEAVERAVREGGSRRADSHAREGGIGWDVPVTTWVQRSRAVCERADWIPPSPTPNGAGALGMSSRPGGIRFAAVKVFLGRVAQ